MTLWGYDYEVSQIKLLCLYLGFFICNSNRNISHLLLLTFQHFAVNSSPDFTNVLYRATSCFISCCQKSASCVISRGVTTVSASPSSLYIRSPRFRFSAGTSWRWRGNTLSWCDHSQCTVVTKVYALQISFLTDCHVGVRLCHLHVPFQTAKTRPFVRIFLRIHFFSNSKT
jgi:hypothetical protein